nr:TPA_asm: hypothetical protein HUJ06_010068 [Nelumbo nucifera]
MLYHHFQDYYEALDLAASDDVSQLLYPEWRNSIEKPFLWLGDFHPSIFTNLLRSFLNDSEDGNNFNNRDRRLLFALAWKDPSKALMSRIEQIECGLRLMVPALVDRARNAQAAFIERVAVDWENFEGRKEVAKSIIAKAAMAQIEELVTIFLDANRLRRSILMEIMGATDVYQAALYLERLAEFFVGFLDTGLLLDFEHCRMPITFGI